MLEFLKEAVSYMRGFPGQIKTTICLTIILCILCVIFGAKAKKLDPKGKTPLVMVPFVAFIDMMNKFAKENMGKRWRFYAPFFTSIVIFIFFANTCSIFGLSNPTSYLVINFGVAIVVFFVIQISGIVSHGFFGYLKELCSPNPIMLPMNLISELVLPVSLSLRLFGNIVSGSALCQIVVGICGYWCIPFLGAFNLVFDIFFGVIQTAVFALLSMIFTSNKISDEDKIFSTT